MSFELKISPRERAGGRFIGAVRKRLIDAAVAEKSARGITQQQIADQLEVNRSVINRLLKGAGNLTLRSVGEIAWALGYEPQFKLVKKGSSRQGKNYHDGGGAPAWRTSDEPTKVPSPNTPSGLAKSTQGGTSEFRRVREDA